jgi:ribonuclease HI
MAHTKHSDDDFAAELEDLERSLLNIDARKSNLMVELLSEDFQEFGSSGVIHTKDDVVASLRSELPTHISAENVKVRLLSPQTALLTYRACRHTDPPIYSLRSSIWQRGPAGWQMLFHQGTVTPEIL